MISKEIRQAQSPDFYLGYKTGYEAAQPKWISVEERLPEVENENNTFESTEDVLAVDKDGNIYAGYFRIYKFDGTTEFCGVEFDYYCRVHPVVTHWMPLPSAPDETTTPKEAD